MVAFVTGFGQQRFTISGVISDAESGEALIGASIYNSANELGTVTNNYGFFSLTLPENDSLTLVISHLGFVPQVKLLRLHNNLDLTTTLVPGSIDLDELVVVGNTPRAHIDGVQMGVVNVPLKDISEIPTLLGEADVLKVIQLMPGVQFGNEGTSGFYVRGGNSDQNLVQLDEAIVYNPEFFDIYGGHDGVNIILKDPKGAGNYYRFKMTRQIDNSVSHAHILDVIQSTCAAEGEKFWVTDFGRTIFSDEGNDGRVLDLLAEVSFEYSEGDSTWVTMQSLDEKAALFYKELDDQLISIVNPFVEPVFLESKIEGGAVGFFGSVVPSDSVLFIYTQDNP